MIEYCQDGCGQKVRPGSRYLRGHNKKGSTKGKQPRTLMAIAIQYIFDRTPCECKCGELAFTNKRFVTGHNGKFTIYPPDWGLWSSLNQLGKNVKESTREKQSLIKTGTKDTEETRRKKRCALLKHVEKYGPFRVGKNEKQILDEQEKKENIKIIRSFKIKELGYCVDGYCKETNTCYEVDEYSSHYSLKSREHDAKRQKEIEEHLHCKFIRIEEAEYLKYLMGD